LEGKVKFLQENVSVLPRSAFDLGNLPFSEKLQEKQNSVIYQGMAQLYNIN